MWSVDAVLIKHVNICSTAFKKWDPLWDLLQIIFLLLKVGNYEFSISDIKSLEEDIHFQIHRFVHLIAWLTNKPAPLINPEDTNPAFLFYQIFIMLLPKFAFSVVESWKWCFDGFLMSTAYEIFFNIT